jgi:hypothetical protein
MGTWDIGPFDNDNAADFAGALDRADEAQRFVLVRDALAAVVDGREEYLDGDEAVGAVASAALIAGQLPGGRPVVAYGPREPLPDLTGLREAAVAALGRVLAAKSEVAELWDEAGHGELWRQGIGRLLQVLRGE